jgi:hypothetical protein
MRALSHPVTGVDHAPPHPQADRHNRFDRFCVPLPAARHGIGANASGAGDPRVVDLRGSRFLLDPTDHASHQVDGTQRFVSHVAEQSRKPSGCWQLRGAIDRTDTKR